MLSDTGANTGREQSQKLNFASLSLNKVSKIKKEKDLEIAEIHNRITNLLIEEERAARKIEQTRRKALEIAEIQAKHDRSFRDIDTT